MSSIPDPYLPDIPSRIVINDNHLVIETASDGLYTLTIQGPSGNCTTLTTYDYSDLVMAHQKEVFRLNRSTFAQFFHSPIPPEDIPQ